MEYELFLNRSIWPIIGTWIGITTPGLSEFGSNGNEEVLHTSKISRKWASLSNSVKCHKGRLCVQILKNTEKNDVYFFL